MNVFLNQTGFAVFDKEAQLTSETPYGDLSLHDDEYAKLDWGCRGGNIDNSQTLIECLLGTPFRYDAITGGSQQGLMPLLLVVVYTNTAISNVTWIQPCAFKANYSNNTRLQQINLLLSESFKCHAEYSGTCVWGFKKITVSISRDYIIGA